MNRTLPVLLAATMWVSACREKKADAPPKPVEVKAQAAPAKPPPEAQPRAEKECAAPLEPGPEQEMKVGDRNAKAAGATLSFADADADGALNLGLLGPMNEDSGENLWALKKYFQFFNAQKVDAVVFLGDVGEVADGIARVLKAAAAETKKPIFVIAGNSECRSEYTDGVTAARKDADQIVNLNAYRSIKFPELTLVSLPGFHDTAFMRCQTGCRYFSSTVDEVIQAAKESQQPVVLLSHGPPHGKGNAALDFSVAGDVNAGDTQINRAIKEGAIAFGLFANIMEAGDRSSSEPEGSQQVKQDEWSKSLYVAAGPSNTMKWSMNDGTVSHGMAHVVSFKDGQASFKTLRLKAMTAAEKTEATKLKASRTAK